MVEETTITKANPTNFSFDVPLTIEKHESPIIDLLSDLVANTGDPESTLTDRHDQANVVITPKQLKAFDMYILTGSSLFKLENAIITSGAFDINPSTQFTVRIEGVGTKLDRVGDENATIPGNAVSGSFWSDASKPYHQLGSRTRTPLLVYPVLSIDSLDMSHIMSATIQIQNNISWTPYETLQQSLLVTNNDVTTLMRPSNYTVTKRDSSGEIRQYQIDNNNSGDNVRQFDNFSTSSNLTIKAVQVGKASSDVGFFKININPVSYTARMNASEVYTQSYDWRSLDSRALSTQITQYS